MIGKVIINANGEKAISFDDAAWAALPVGATIYAAGNGEFEPATVSYEERYRTLKHGQFAVPERLGEARDDLKSACIEAVPAFYFMTAPDGPDFPLTDLVRRMGTDASRYCLLREEAVARGEDLDGVVDQRMRGEI